MLQVTNLSAGFSSGCRAFLVLSRVRSRALSEALVVEMEVQSALRRNEKPFSNAYKAAVLNIKLLHLGLVPNWKHLATPVGCLLQWETNTKCAVPCFMTIRSHRLGALKAHAHNIL